MIFQGLVKSNVNMLNIFVNNNNFLSKNVYICYNTLEYRELLHYFIIFFMVSRRSKILRIVKIIT